MAGILASAIRDAFMSFLFIFLGSTAGATVMLLAPYFGEDEMINLVLLLSVIAVQLVVFGAMADAMGGASFNPTANLANYWLGEGNESVLSMGIKIPAQLAGAALGAFAILAVMPEEYQHTLSGPKLGPGVDMWTGILAEGVLTFIVNIVILWIFMAGPKSFVMRTACLVVGILTLIVIGAPYTGPAMNPAMAFAWAYVQNSHATPEHFYVYWLAPMVGTILAAIVFSLTLHPARKAKVSKVEASAGQEVKGSEKEESEDMSVKEKTS